MLPSRRLLHRRSLIPVAEKERNEDDAPVENREQPKNRPENPGDKKERPKLLSDDTEIADETTI